MSRRKRSFIWHPYGPSQPVEKLKFAVVNEDHRLVSAVWTVFPAHNAQRPDIYVTASGFSSTAKFSFHRDVLNHSFLSHAHQGLVEQGIVAPGSRHTQCVEIPSLPFHGLTLRLVPEFLRKEGHSPDPHKGTIVALPIPPKGTVLEIGFFLAEGTEINIEGAQAAIGHVVSGGRALVVVLALRELDADAYKADIDGLIKRIPITPDMSARVEPTNDLAMMLYGQEEAGFLTVTEVHNVRYRPPNSGGDN